MKTAPDCLPCLLSQTLDAARFATPNPATHAQVTHQALGALAALDPDQSPPAAVQTIQRLLRQSLHNDDPYRAAKQRFNALALRLLPRLRTAIERTDDPFGAATRFAIAGNVIDLGVFSRLGEEETETAILRALTLPFHGDLAAFAHAVGSARRILYLTDNAGEIVLDRLLIERLPADRVTVAVRGAPVLNDATLADAETAGLTELATVIANGSDAPGTLLDDCSPAFREAFAAADLIIAKGQGNFESLADVTANTYFLLQVKCRLIARHLGRNYGDQVLWHAPRIPRSTRAATGPRHRSRILSVSAPSGPAQLPSS